MTADPHEMSQHDRIPGASGLSLGNDGYRTLFEHVDSMACMLDLEGRFTAVNPAGERLTGYSADELLGRFAAELIAPGSREEAVERFLRRIRTAGDLAPDESVLVTKAGDEVPIEVRSVQVLDHGRPVGVLGLVRDLRPERHFESTLHDSEAQFRSAFEHAAIGMALLSADGCFVRVNGALAEMLGYETDALGGLHFSDVTHPEDVERQSGLFEQLLAGEIDACHMEKRFVRRDGSELRAILSASLVRATDGAPLHFVSQIQDITEQKRALERVAAHETQLAEAQQLARLGSWEWDVERDLVDWSAELYRIYGLEPDTDLTYETYLETIHPEDRVRWAGTVRNAIESGEPYSIEHRIVLPDGTVRWVHGRGEAERANGRTVRLRGTAQDVTERCEAELRLREAEERFRTLVEQLPLVTYVRPLDMHASNVYVSPQVEDMLGYPADEWMSDRDLLSRIVHPDDLERVVADGEHVRRTGEPSRHEYRYLHPDGRTVWVLDQTHLVTDENGRPTSVQGFLVDVTERRNAEIERDQLREALHHAQKLEALGRLAGGVAHDFNNMLTAIKGYAELLLESLPPGAGGRGEAEQIRRAAEQASTLPRQLLAFGRKQELQARVIPLDGTLADARELLTRLGTEDVDVVVVPGAAAASVVADPHQLEQALLNLTLNARDAMPDGGTVTVSSRTASVSAAVAEKHGVAPGRYAVVSVADTGTGMDESTQARAFEPFFTTKGQGNGTGLGLSMVYGFVTQSGGFVDVESAPGEGSRFDVYLPQTVVESSVPDELDDERLAARRARVALVEDEPVVRDLARTSLERAGFDVVVAGTGAEALERFGRDSLDLEVLVSDMVMPGMSGRELADRFLALRPNTKVVLMSGFTDELAALRGEHVFLQKPFAPRELVAAVEAALDREGADESTAGGRPTCLVADDHPAVLDSVARFLAQQGFEVVATVARGDEALAEIAALRPSVALLDVSMQPVGGIDVARRVAAECPGTRTVLYTGHRDAALLEQALDAGARGFVLKEAPLSELVRALEVVGDGGTYVDPELSGALAHLHVAASSSPLTPREREVLALLANGLTNDKVGALLGISAETVQSHVGNAMSKLEADTRTEAVATALRQSLIA